MNGHSGMRKLELRTDIDLIGPVFPALQQRTKHRLRLHHGRLYIPFQHKANVGISQRRIERQRSQYVLFKNRRNLFVPPKLGQFGRYAFG